MTTLTIVSFLMGVTLGQRFKVMVLMPAMLLVPGIWIVTGIAHAQSAWAIAFMVATAAACLQIGYIVGIGLRHILSTRSSSLPSPATAAKHAAP